MLTSKARETQSKGTKLKTQRDQSVKRLACTSSTYYILDSGRRHAHAGARPPARTYTDAPSQLSPTITHPCPGVQSYFPEERDNDRYIAACRPVSCSGCSQYFYGTLGARSVIRLWQTGVIWLGDELEVSLTANYFLPVLCTLCTHMTL